MSMRVVGFGPRPIYSDRIAQPEAQAQGDRRDPEEQEDAHRESRSSL